MNNCLVCPWNILEPPDFNPPMKLGNQESQHHLYTKEQHLVCCLAVLWQHKTWVCASLSFLATNCTIFTAVLCSISVVQSRSATKAHHPTHSYGTQLCGKYQSNMPQKNFSELNIEEKLGFVINELFHFRATEKEKPTLRKTIIRCDDVCFISPQHALLFLQMLSFCDLF